MTPSESDVPGRAGGAPGLRVGFVPGVTLTKWRRIWAERLRGVPLDVVEVRQQDQRRALVTGEVDMCFVRLPVDTDGLHTIRLYEEVPVVVVPKDHTLASFEEVELADLDGLDLVGDDEAATGIDRVAWGAGVMVVPQSVARSHSRRDLVYRPVTDAEPTSIALAWLVDNPNELVEEFIGIVRGRTENSSRTAASRALKAPSDTTPAPAQRRPAGPSKNGRRTGGRPGRGQTRR